MARRRTTEMLLNAETVDGIVIVNLPETITSTNNRAFDKDLVPMMGRGTKMVFDMTQVRHMDSSGLGSIVACLKHLRTAGGDLKLCCLSKQVRTLFEMVRMHHVVDIFNTRQEVIDSYKVL